MLAVVSGKGGCGKTTTTLGIATACANDGLPVQIVDLDVEMPDLHVLAGVDRPPTLCSDVPADRLRPAPGRPGVSVAPAPRPAQARLIQQSIAALPDRPTLLDAPAGAGRAATRPLVLADGALLVTTLRQESLEDAMKTAAMAEALSTPLVGVVVRGANAVPTGLSERFDVDADAVVSVPEAKSAPLADRRVKRQYKTIAARLRSCRQFQEKGYGDCRRTGTNE